MEGKELFDYKNENLMKAINRQGAKYVPTVLASSCSEIAWTGQKVVDIIYDKDAYAKGMTDILKVMWADGNTFSGTLFTPSIENNLEGVQNRFSPDGITPEHVQQTFMERYEYDELIKDPNRFVSEILLPRKFPRFYTDREYAKKMMKIVAEDKAYCLGVLFPAVSKVLREEYGVTDFVDFSQVFSNPLDTIFDYLRGFKGSLIDVRSQYDKVKEACAALWEAFNIPSMRPEPPKFPYACHMTHIAPYLPPQKFTELYWPYEKYWINHQAQAGSKVWIMLEGTWKPVLELFQELPKDSCILHVDDDDIYEVKKLLGDCQIIEGGMRQVKVLSYTKDQILDETKRIIDGCAPGEGFIFCTDKSWISPRDCNQNLIDSFNCAHEYSQR